MHGLLTCGKLWMFQKFKNITAFFPSSEASDFEDICGQIFYVIRDCVIISNWLRLRGPPPHCIGATSPTPHPVWVFRQFNLCGQAGPGKKLVVSLTRKVQRGGWVMNYGRGPAEPVGGEHLYHATDRQPGIKQCL